LHACAATRTSAEAELPRGLPLTGTLRVGLVGCGGRGTGAAFNALASTAAETQLVAVGDLFAGRIEGSLKGLENQLATTWAGAGTTLDDGTVVYPPGVLEAAQERAQARIQVPAERRFIGFEAFQKVIDSGIDVVILTTPPAFRPAQMRYAVERGVHVFCEKPMAVDVPGVHDVLASAEAAKQKGLSVLAGFCWRYKRGHQALYSELHNGRIGDLTAVYTNYNTGQIGSQARQPGWSDVEWQVRNWHHFDWLSGSHLVEQACHSLDLMAWAFDDVPPLSVVAVGGQATRSGPEAGNCFDHYSAVYDYPNGAKGFHMSRQWANTDGENNNYFFGSRGQGWLENWTPRYELVGSRRWLYEGDTGDDMYQNEVDALLTAIRTGRPLNHGTRMAHSTLLAIMARLAATSGKVVTWEQALASTHRLGPASLAWGEYTYDPLPVPGQAPLI
jgi:myo-inositol 2-dehydrogenase / D-chiro-inositol 1-dehydrogenase